MKTTKGPNKGKSSSTDKKAIVTPIKNDNRFMTLDPDNFPEAAAEEEDESFSFDNDFGKLLEDVYSEVKLSSRYTHEIVHGLTSGEIGSWESFLNLCDEDLDMLTKPSRSKPVPISPISRRRLRNLHSMVMENIQENGAQARDIHLYNKEVFNSYCERINLQKRQGLANSAKQNNLPIITSSPIKSPGEKNYETWSRTCSKKTKDAFETLKEDDQYVVWKPSFTAELEHQKLSHILDPEYNPDAITCSFEKEMVKEQIAYIWTVILYVFKNPLGRACVSEHMDTRNARQAYFDHEKLQDQSPARAFSISIYLNHLTQLSLKGHSGTASDFLATWFEELRKLNEVSKDSLNYDMTKGLLLKAVQGNKELSDEIAVLEDTGQKSLNLAQLKTKLLSKASLYDRQSTYLKLGKLSKTKTLAHIIEDDTDHDQQWEINKTRRTPNPEARLPEEIFKSFDNQTKADWRNIPEGTRIELSKLISGRQFTQAPERKIYAHEVDTYSNDTTSEITDDHFLVNRSSVRNKSDDTRTTQTSETTSTKKSGELPRRSELDPAHPSRLLAQKPTSVYNSDKQRLGYINKAHSCVYHNWYTIEDEKLDSAQSDNIPTTITYSVSSRKIAKTTMGLVDRGANGSVGGSDCVWIGGSTSAHPRTVSITGIDNHQLTNVPVGTVGAHAISNRGPVIVIFNETAYTGRHTSIVSSLQLEAYGNMVSDRNPAVGGTGTISTNDGYIFPLSFVHGLPYLKLRTYSTEEYNSLPHVIL